MLSKRGDSLVVAWVLLLGLSISLAIFVGAWLKNISERTGSEVVDKAARDQMCADSVIVVVSQDCTTNPKKLTIKNTGSFNIIKVKCSKPSAVNDVVLGPLAPGSMTNEIQTQGLNNCIDTGTVNIIPFIDIEGKDVACAEKSVRVTC